MGGNSAVVSDSAAREVHLKPARRTRQVTDDQMIGGTSPEVLSPVVNVPADGKLDGEGHLRQFHAKRSASLTKHPDKRPVA